MFPFTRSVKISTMKKLALITLAATLLFSCGNTPQESSSSIFSSESSASTDATYHFYCVNDFHGSIVEQMNGKYYESGIAKYFGKLKEYKQADPDHTFILSAGDMFQGSLESNDNYGALVIDAMNNTGFDAMTLGNHEFDYGQERLLNNIRKMDFPILGGNIVTFENGAATTTRWSEDIHTSTVIERGGNKIGIVGMIGYGQTTSITSQNVQDIYFRNPFEVAPAEAKRLREEEDCDIVIYVIHDDMSSCQTYAADKQYFDGVFCGHKHVKNNKIVGKVPFVQSYCNGEAISHFALNIKGGVVTCTDYGIITAEKSWTEDTEIAQIRDSYIEDPVFAAKASAIAGTIDGTLEAKEGVSNLVARAIYEKYKPLYPELRGAMQNGLRAPLTGEVSYRDIYKAAPFTNHVVIAKVPGNEILLEAEQNSFYCDGEPFKPDEYYTFACIDYVLYHQNDRKVFNYFPSLNENFEEKILADIEDYPFDIAFEFIRDFEDGTVNANDYLSSAPGFQPQEG